jgi:ribA/ribD-fused uncharacterized protein
MLQKQQISEKTKVKVLDDLPQQVVNNRKTIVPIFYAGKNLNMNIKMRYDEIILDGNKLITTDNLEELPDAIKPTAVFTQNQGSITAFSSINSPLSNLYHCDLEINNKIYTSVEQCYQETKALYFGDTNTANLIIATDDPYRCKAMGNMIKGFDRKRWEEVRLEKMTTMVRQKFNSSLQLKDYLLRTTGSSLAEATSNRFWGTGILLRDKSIWEKQRWKGKNQLGVILEKIRQELI